jgi:hypothetical protein
MLDLILYVVNGDDDDHHHHWLDSPVWALPFFKSFPFFPI